MCDRPKPTLGCSAIGRRRRCILIVRPCILNIVYVFLLWSMYSYCSSMYSYCCLCIVIVVYVFLDAATLTEVFPCFFLGCKANARVILAKTGHGLHSSKIVVLFYVLFVLYRPMYCLCVNVYCHRVTTQLQLTDISISISNDARQTRAIKCSIAMSKAAFNNKKTLLISK